MANTVHGPFVKGAATATGSYGTGVGQSNTYTSGNANNDETQSAVALASFNPDLVGAGFILSGIACVKDVTTPTQLNITSGEAYLVMTDGTTARIDVASATESTTGHPSATLFLGLNPDGSWSWGTAHSAQANYLPIAQVTTDASANISAVSDKRVMLVSALTGAAHSSVGQPGGAALPAPLAVETTQSALSAGSVVGGVTFGQVGALRGSMDTAASLNGSTGYISVPTSGLPASGATFSLEAWVKLAANPASAGPILVLGQTGSRTFFQVNSAGTVSVGSGSTITSPSAISLNAWHHLVATYDGATLTLYVDGASVASGASSSAITYGNAWIGQSLAGAFLSGLLDEVAIYGAALSAARVTAHYNAGVSTTSDAYAATVLNDAPLRYYRLGDAAGATFAVDTINATATSVVNADGALATPVQAALGVAQWQPVDSGGVVYDNITAPDGQARSRMLRANSGSNVAINCLALNTDGSITPQGAIGGLGGQASVGSFGAPVIVAQAINTHVTATAVQVILTFAVQVTGLYRVSFYAYIRGSGNPSSITAKVGWVEPNDASTQFSYFTIQSVNAGGVNPATLSNASVPTANIVAAFPAFIYASTGHNIVVDYTNATATPNDNVSAMIERLA